MVEPSVKTHILEKRENNEVEWTQLKILEKAYVRQEVETENGKEAESASLSVGEKIWIHKSHSASVSADWLTSLNEVKSLEASLGTKNLSKKITRLRQLSHGKDLPFDLVIGTKAGNKYLNDLESEPNKWSLFNDFAGLHVPAGEIVDLHHLLVCLDARQRNVRKVSYHGVPVGKSWSAATWAGDLGAAATDMRLRVDENWESERSHSSLGERVSHYLSSRMPSPDLWGDIDGWSVPHRKKARSVGEVIFNMYKQPYLSKAKVRSENRRQALEEFLRHNGFEFYVDDKTKARSILRRQRKAVKRLASEIFVFSRIWLLYRKRYGAIFHYDSREEKRISIILASIFTDLLEVESRALNCDTRLIS